MMVYSMCFRDEWKLEYDDVLGSILRRGGHVNESWLVMICWAIWEELEFKGIVQVIEGFEECFIDFS